MSEEEAPSLSPPRRTGWMRFLVGVLLPWGVAQGLMRASGQGHPVAAFLVTYPSVLMMGPGLLWLMFAWSLRRRLALPLGFLAGTVVFLCGVNVPWRTFWQAPPQQAITIGTWNVFMGARGPNGIVRQLGEHGADIWVLQEVTSWKKYPGLDHKAVGRAVGGARTLAQAGDVMVASRFPMVDRKDTRLGDNRVAVGVKLKTGLGPLWVVGCHFEANSRGERKILRRAVKMAPLGAQSVDISLRQTKLILELLDGLDAPAVIAGDFNAGPLMPPGTYLRRTHLDAFVAAGWGPGYTFRSDFPVLRIDQLYVPGHWRVADVKVIKTERSDHLAVLARVGPPPEMSQDETGEAVGLAPPATLSPERF